MTASVPISPKFQMPEPAESAAPATINGTDAPSAARSPRTYAIAFGTSENDAIAIDTTQNHKHMNLAS